ncbi:MAG: AsnC family transcriptional regulator, partial [Euryarchaeota archaeon]|nr:AsnC family transcriptional regulator [Euryarchaeota archaeon]
MDELDREILDVLRHDARIPYTEIADRVDTSEGTVRNRVERMVETDVIERFTVATRTGNIKAMIELGVDVAVDTTEVATRMAEW